MYRVALSNPDLVQPLLQQSLLAAHYGISLHLRWLIEKGIAKMKSRLFKRKVLYRWSTRSTSCGRKVNG
jgi:hypothetical protein